MTIDKKDKRILYELDMNARQSVTQIGKKVHLPKTVVSYRIKRLEKSGTIQNYYTIIDASRLGYTSIRFYLTFQHTTPQREEEIIAHFIKNSRTWWVASTEPLFDCAVIMWVKDMGEFYTFWENTLAKYSSYLKEYTNSIYVQAVHYKCEYLIDRKEKQEKPDVVGSNQRIEIEKPDFRILQLLSKNARMPITTIARKLSTTAKIVQYRMKKLKQNGVIIGFRANIDISKLGFQNYRLNTYLTDYSERKKIETFITNNPYLVYVNKTIGGAHLEYEFHFPSTDSFHTFINQIKTTFPESIRSYNSFVFKKVYKEEFMPLD